MFVLLLGFMRVVVVVVVDCVGEVVYLLSYRLSFSIHIRVSALISVVFDLNHGSMSELQALNAIKISARQKLRIEVLHFIGHLR